MKKLIILLVRLRLGVKIGQQFQFTNQRADNEFYFFTDTALMKLYKGKREYIAPSGVSLNWLLNDKCEIRKAGQ